MSRWEAARRRLLRSPRAEPLATRARGAWAWAGEAGAAPGAPRPEQRRNVSRGRRGRGSTRAAGWGSRWAASGRLPGSSSRSRAESGAAAQPGPRAAGGTRRGVPQTPASTSSPSTVSASGAGEGREGGRRWGGVGARCEAGGQPSGGEGWRGAREWGRNLLPSGPVTGGEAHPSPRPARLSSLAGSVWGRRQRERGVVLGTQARLAAVLGQDRGTVEQGLVSLGREG